MATSTYNELFPSKAAAHTALSNSQQSKGAAGWPLRDPGNSSPTPSSRKNIPMTLTTSTHFKPIFEKLLKSPINSKTSTIPTSKFVIKVETTPPTIIVYTGTTECIHPTRLVITTTYPTTTCMTMTQVSFTSSYTTTAVTGKPGTTITSTYPTTTTERVTSTIITSPITTAPKKTTTTTLPLSSSVPTTLTTLDTLISMTSNTKKTIPTTAKQSNSIPHNEQSTDSCRVHSWQRFHDHSDTESHLTCNGHYSTPHKHRIHRGILCNGLVHNAHKHRNTVLHCSHYTARQDDGHTFSCHIHLENHPWSHQ
ncbi:mucin-3B-like [Rousettus aegyptiacus]|uniref:mucin-3B-like n=1 Tax=Rousettus aegyptiacus TaxID=9407 RepID=UPI00168D4EF4|nr:mucin-3B-like [Rousettus aegyptiacus]